MTSLLFEQDVLSYSCIDLAKETYYLYYRTSLFRAVVKHIIVRTVSWNCPSFLNAVSFSRLNMATFEKSSSVLIRYFVQTIFISVDIAVHEGVLFCDLFCDLKPPFPGQVTLNRCSLNRSLMF